MLLTAIAASMILSAQPPPRSYLPRPVAGSGAGRFWTIEQLNCPKAIAVPPAQLRALRSLEEVESVMRTNNIACERGRSTFDPSTADPRLIQSIDKLPPGEVFVIPQGETLIFNRVITKH